MTPSEAVRVPCRDVLDRLVPQARALERALPALVAEGRVMDGTIFEPERKRCALILAAGPSVREVLAVVSEHHLRDDLAIYCVDVALPIALSMGVVPHVVVSLDPMGEILAKPFACSVEIAPGSMCSLLAPTYSCPRALAAWNPTLPIFLYNALCEDVAEYEAVRMMRLARFDLSSKSNVGFFSVNAAIEMGHTAVAWAGLDFSFPAGQAYAPGTVHGDDPTRFAGQMVLDRERKPVRTSFAYMANAENFVEHHEKVWKHHAETFNLSRGILPFSYDAAPFLERIISRRRARGR